MATKTFYLSSNTATGASVPQLNESNSGYTTKDIGGWNMASADWPSAPSYKMWAYLSTGTNNATGSSTTDYIDSGSNTGPGASGLDYVRTESTYTGTFAAGDWSINFNISGNVSNRKCHVRFKVWRSTSPTGSGTTLIGSAFDGPSYYITGTLQYPVTWTAPSITLSNEYLFFQFELVMENYYAENGFINLRSSTVRTWTTTDFTASSGSVVFEPLAPFRHMLVR